MPPPLTLAEFPLTVQLVSVACHVVFSAAAEGGGVSADGAVGQRGRAAVVQFQAAAAGCGVAADGAVGQREFAAVVVQAAAVDEVVARR